MPNIHEILSGVKLQNGVSLSRKAMLEKLGVNFVQQSVANLNHEFKKITLNSGEELNFDACLKNKRNDKFDEIHERMQS